MILKNKQDLLLENSKLQGDRVTLRPIGIDDLSDLFEFTSDEEATRYLYLVHQDIEQTKDC